MATTSHVTVHDIRRAQRADTTAAVLAIGTANPVTCISQADYPDYYFRITNTEHLTDLKRKLNNLCKMRTYILTQLLQITKVTMIIIKLTSHLP